MAGFLSIVDATRPAAMAFLLGSAVANAGLVLLVVLLVAATMIAAEFMV